MDEMKTPINISEDSSWLSDLEMVGEYILFDKDCNLKMNLFDADEEQEFLSYDIASALAFEEQKETLEQCLTTECISTNLSKTFTEETSFESFDDFHFDFEKPAKQLKTIVQTDNDDINKNFTLKVSTSPPSYQLPHILSFDNPNPTETSALLPESGKKKFSNEISKGSSKKQNLERKASRAKRSPANIRDHIMAERKRREDLSQRFIALAALIPDLKKMDKSSILTESIKYVKELKERLEILEKQGKKPKPDQSIVAPTKPILCIDKHYSSSDESTETESAADGTTTAMESLFKVEAKVSGKQMLIRIHCQKHNGLLVKIITEIQSFQLFVVCNSVVAFGDSVLDITVIVEIGERYKLSKEELVKNLRMAALKFYFGK